MSFYGNIYADPHISVYVEKNNESEGGYKVRVKNSQNIDLSETSFDLPFDTILTGCTGTLSGDTLQLTLTTCNANSPTTEQTSQVIEIALSGLSGDILTDKAIATGKIDDGAITWGKLNSTPNSPDNVVARIATYKYDDGILTITNIAETEVEQ